MASLSGIVQRPLVAAAAVAIASVSTELSDKLSPFKSSGASSSAESLDSSPCNVPFHVSVSKLSNLPLLNRVQVPVPNVKGPAFNPGRHFVTPLFCFSFAYPAVLVKSYQLAELAKVHNPIASNRKVLSPISSSDVLYRWHLPESCVYNASGYSDCFLEKSRTVVVLLGWLGARQKHLNRYADWYTSKGFNVITFTFPMAEILSYQVGGKAEEDIDLLADHLADWLEEDNGKNLIFHTFSNTGWLTYGVILEKFQKKDPSLVTKIRGCVVDSAPVAVPDPRVWASGFSAAFLKKQSVATKGLASVIDLNDETAANATTIQETKPAVAEAVLLLVLEKFFKVVLNLPIVNRRLCDIIDVLSSGQPNCPQLYIYSSADRVIPVGSVESFIEQQRKAGREVRACNFVSTPHVDHFRKDPKLYTSQLSHFLDSCVLGSGKQSNLRSLKY